MRDLEWSMSEAAASMASSSLLAGGAFRSFSSPPRAGDMATASEGARVPAARGRPNPGLGTWPLCVSRDLERRPPAGLPEGPSEN